jgi:hypothetical protein
VPDTQISSIEEGFLWDCALNWRSPENLSIPHALDWERFLAVAESNRMLTVLDQVFLAQEFLGRIPATIADKICDQAEEIAKSAGLLSTSLKEYLQRAHQKGLDTVVHKGLWLSIEVYGRASIRPGNDIDILVREGQIQESLAILEAMGLGQFWPNLLHDRYYERHHLHLQRCSKDLKIWFETHWALDHPYTLLTIDYEAMLDRASSGILLGEPVLCLSPADLLLSLAVHLVKHAVYLPTLIERTDLPQIILADGMLMYYVDIVEVIKQYGDEIDWSFCVDLAMRSGCIDILGSVLQVCRDQLNAPVPDWVVQALPVNGHAGLSRRVMHKMADHEISVYRGEEPDKVWQFLVVTNGAFILRPVRILDLIDYVFPHNGYILRRYGAVGWKIKLKHYLKAVRDCMALGADTLYFTLERYRRLKRLKLSASLFNRLEVDA